MGPLAIAVATACAPTGDSAVLVANQVKLRDPPPAAQVSAPFARGPDRRGCGYLELSPAGPAVARGPLYDRVAEAMTYASERAVVDWVQPARSPQALEAASMVIAHWGGRLRWCLVPDEGAVLCDRQGEVARVIPHDDRLTAARIAALMDHAVRVIPNARTAALCTPAPASVRSEIVAPTLYWAEDGRWLAFVEQIQPHESLAQLVRVDVGLTRQGTRRHELLSWDPRDER